MFFILRLLIQKMIFLTLPPDIYPVPRRTDDFPLYIIQYSK
jgi:hypothetical protein